MDRASSTEERENLNKQWGATWSERNAKLNLHDAETAGGTQRLKRDIAMDAKGLTAEIESINRQRRRAKLRAEQRILDAELLLIEAHGKERPRQGR